MERELRDRHTQEFRDFCAFKLTVRDPKERYVAEVNDAVRDKHYGISAPDVDVAALMLELSDAMSDTWIDPSNVDSVETLCCLTKDNGIKSALALFGLYDDPAFLAKTYRLRCFGCYAVYDREVDFCRKCGYDTITRVTVVGEGSAERMMFSKNFRYRPRVLRDRSGVVIRTEDQKEYGRYVRERERRSRGDEGLH